MDTGKHIVETQNSDYCISQLAAQKRLYSRAKSLFFFQCIVVTILPVAISVIQLVVPADRLPFLWIFVSYGIIASVLEVAMEMVIGNIKKTAASIQELFDCTVLNIAWNSVLLEERPQPETVYHHANRFKKSNSVSNLFNWYSTEVKYIKTNIATVVCQRTNCVYDFALRRQYSTSIGSLAVVVFLVLLIASTADDLTLQKFMTNVLVPSIPIFILAIKQLVSNTESIANLRSLRGLIEGTLATASLSSSIDENVLRQIQDKIFINRNLSPMLPDWVFYKFRPGLEEEMNMGVVEVIRSIKP